MIILGDALLTAPPPKPMEHTDAVRGWFDQGGDEPHKCRFFGGLARAAKSGIRLKGGGIAQGSGWP